MAAYPCRACVDMHIWHLLGSRNPAIVMRKVSIQIFIVYYIPCVHICMPSILLKTDISHQPLTLIPHTYIYTYIHTYIHTNRHQPSTRRRTAYTHTCVHTYILGGSWP